MLYPPCSAGRQPPAGGLAGLELVDDIGLGLEAAAAGDLAGRVGVAGEGTRGHLDRQATGRKLETEHEHVRGSFIDIFHCS